MGYIGRRLIAVLMACLALGVTASAGPADDEALAAIKKMARHFAGELAVDGGYVWEYSPDGAVRRGEGGEVRAGVTWTQPPGTPAIGGVFLRLYELTGDESWLDAARSTAQALVWSQLLSGGWYNFADTDPDARTSWCYIAEGIDGQACRQIDDNDRRDRSTIDDNITQSALGFLIWLSELTDDPGPYVRDAINFGFRRLKLAQYRNGAWPVRLDNRFPSVRMAAAWRARYPDEWSREWVKPNERPVFLTNDNVLRDMVRVLLAGAESLEDKELLAAAMRSGDFLLAAQMPAPQRGWAQAYNADLTPIWGRSFEPPALASRETAGAIEALLQLYLRTGKTRYLEGALEAAAWLRESRLDTGEWARFYELQTNTPLFVDSEDRLTYDHTDLHEGYGMLGDFGIERVLDLVDAVESGKPVDAFTGWKWIFRPTPAPANPDVLAALKGVSDSDAPFVEDGWIRASTLINAMLAYDRHAPTD